MNRKACDFFGVEVECFRDLEKPNTKTPALFTTTTDGSISDPNGEGVEFISNKIAFADKKAVSQFKKGLDKIAQNHFVNRTCGLHIHLNLPLNYLFKRQRLKKMLVAYRLFEPSFFSFVSHSRRHNSFCRRLSEFNAFRDFNKLIKEDVWDLWGLFFEYNSLLDKVGKRKIIADKIAQSHSKSANFRYLFINLQSIFYHGSLEVRLHQATTDKTKIWNWLQLHKKFLLKIFSWKFTLKDLVKLYEKYGQEALWKIVEDEKLKEYYTKKAVEFGKLRDTHKSYNIKIAEAYLKKESCNAKIPQETNGDITEDGIETEDSEEREIPESD